jgi:PadR family transcriptional regulator, regulatory protein AphA
VLGQDTGQGDSSARRLTETSYIVLGMLEQGGPATPYDLKRFAQISTINFWSVPHSQLYAECARLAKEGLLSERQEQTGRRRRIYRVTQAGREALETWRHTPTDELYEARDPTTLKLFFGGDQAILAAPQLKVHQQQLTAFEELLSHAEHMPPGMRLALQAGVEVERVVVRFWARLSENASDEDAPD